MHKEISELINNGWEVETESKDFYIIKKGLCQVKLNFLKDSKTATEKEDIEEICVYDIDFISGKNDNSNTLVCLNELRTIADKFGEDVLFSAKKYCHNVYGKVFNEKVELKEFDYYLRKYNDNGYTMSVKRGLPFFIGVNSKKKDMHFPIKQEIINELYEYSGCFELLDEKEMDFDISCAIDDAYDLAIKAEHINYRRFMAIKNYLEGILHIYDRISSQIDFKKEDIQDKLQRLNSNAIYRFIKSDRSQV